MSSDEELYMVEEILNQRKRKGVLEYLVRWQGFSQLYNSWEPASGVGHCTQLIKAFLDKKKRSRAKSRSRSRGRSGTKSKSRSRSRGRAAKSTSASSRSWSRSRSASRTMAQPTAASRLAVKKEEPPSAKQMQSEKLRRREQVSQQKVFVDRSGVAPGKTQASTSKTEVVSEKAAMMRGSAALERKTETLFKTMQSAESVPSRTHPSLTTRSRLAVRQVENDLNPSSRGRPPTNQDREAWAWWLADYITLAVFIIVSICALSFAVESLTGLREKLVPDFTGLRQRLSENWNDRLQDMKENLDGRMEEINEILNKTSNVVNEGLRMSKDVLSYVIGIFPAWGDDSQNQTAGNSTSSMET